MVALLLVTTTLFANVNHAKFKRAKKPITTSYTIHVNITDEGPNGGFYGTDALHNYNTQVYITDSSLPGISHAVTVGVNISALVNITITDDTGVDNKTIDANYLIQSGQSIFTQVQSAGSNLRVTINSGSVSPTTLSGLPIYIDFTPHYMNY